MADTQVLEKVFLRAYSQSELKRGERLEVKHSLVRRMTALQKVVVKSLHEFKVAHPKLWGLVESNPNIPIYYTSPYGEIDVLVRLSKGVIKKDFPLSPKDFQNSVYNAAISYAQIIFDIHNGYVATSQGFHSLDKILYLLDKKLSRRQLGSALVIHAHGFEGEGTDLIGKSEVLFLSNEETIVEEPFLAELKSTRLFYNDDADEALDEKTIFEKESLQIPWFDFDDDFLKSRVVVDHFHEGVHSQWV